MGIFDRYAPFIQDFIYAHEWESLRGVQVAAGEAIFDSDDHVLLCASTASGKTEAAFFPILTEFWERPPASVGALYIGPTKALINDQFLRLTELCEEADVPVWHWHGDVSASHKARLVRRPSGILQITPESLEALLMHRHAVVGKLFCDLRYVVIDEVHSLLRQDRGGQTLCLVERLSRLAGVDPRRIGLSATIGDPEAVGRLLAAGTGRATRIPRIEEPPRTWRISMEHFYQTGPQANERDPHQGTIAGIPGYEGVPGAAPQAIEAEVLRVEDVPEEGAGPASRGLAAQGPSGQAGGASRPGTADTRPTGSPVPAPKLEDVPDEEASDAAPVAADPGIGYVFEHTRGRKCLIFANSREEAELVCSTLRRYCEASGEPDRFLIHHGNLSTAIRESAEELMRDDASDLSIVATSTLELGIDVGRLERAFQIDAPFTVSSFLQRMGRTGRRGQPPEMWFVMREETEEARALLPETIPWKLLQGIALVQLYLEERWVEPPRLDRLPYSLLCHQTLAILASEGELTPAELAGRVLTLTYFHRVSADDFRVLLRHLLAHDFVEQTESGGLIVGLAGERITGSFKFYAVFQENVEYTVRSDSAEIGTLVAPPPVGEKVAIAGHVWVVEEVDHRRHLLYVTQVKGSVPAYFGECPGDIHTKVLERMRAALAESRPYPYLQERARARLAQARRVTRSSQLLDAPLVCLGETDKGATMWCLLPWLGNYAFLALERLLKIKCAPKLGLKGLESSRPYYLTFVMAASEEAFYTEVACAADELDDPMELLYPGEVPYFEKYDELVPEELVRKGFALGVLDVEGMRARVAEWYERWQLRAPRGPA